MKFIANKDLLLKALLHTRVIMPANISSCYLWANYYQFTLNGQTLTVTGTNGQIFISESIELDDEPSGSPIPGNTFYIHSRSVKILKALEEQPLEFTVEEYQLTVNHSSGYFRVPLMELAYPERKDIDYSEANHLCMEAPGLHSWLSKVSFAATKDEFRPVMGGVFFESEKDRINVSATDAHILMCLSKICQEPNSSTFSFIMPKQVADILCKILPTTGYCELFQRDKTARLVIEDSLQVDFVCIDGRYPNYKSVIPGMFASTFSVDRKQLLKAISRLQFFCSSSTQSVKINVKDTPRHDQLTVSSRNVDENTISQEKVECEFIKGADAFKEGLLVKIPFLTRVISKLPADRVTFHVQDSSRACALKPTPASEKEDITAIVMPLMQSDYDQFDSL